MAGLLGIEWKPKKLTPEQYGLLGLGLGMMGQRGTFGQAVANGGMQGLGMMQQAQDAQNEQALNDFRMQHYQQQQLAAQRKSDEEAAFKSALKTVNVNDKDALANLLLQHGDVNSAVSLMKPDRSGVPTGFIETDKGIAPMPIAGGGNYMDYQLNLANAKNNMVSPIESANLQLRQQSEMRAQRNEERAQANIDRDIQARQDQVALENWKLANPGYEKNAKDITDAQATYEKLKTSMDNYKARLSQYSLANRMNPFTNAALQSAYQAATWPLRDESMINTGVLNPGDIRSLEAALSDPTTWNLKGARGTEELNNQIDEIIRIAGRNVEAIKKAKSPKNSPPMKGVSGGWSGDLKGAADLEAMARRDALRKKYGVNP